MSEDIAKDIAYMRGDAALPRKNGELVFAEPWQGRAFGMAVALHDHDRYAWSEFQAQLIKQIGHAQGETADADYYYQHWLSALEQLLIDKQIIDPEDLQQRVHEYQHGERDEVF